MQIEHVAIWTPDLERLRKFYVYYFGASSGPKYVNPRRQFESYFLSFATGARLELMTLPTLRTTGNAGAAPVAGYAHLAISTGSLAQVDTLTEQLRKDGYTVAGEPRWTGDGYYESVVLDPDGNLVEITV